MLGGYEFPGFLCEIWGWLPCFQAEYSSLGKDNSPARHASTRSTVQHITTSRFTVSLTQLEADIVGTLFEEDKPSFRRNFFYFKYKKMYAFYASNNECLSIWKNKYSIAGYPANLKL